MTVIDTYALQIISDAPAAIVRDSQRTAIPPLPNVAGALREAEENLTDLLPDGYAARITHWTEAKR